MNTEYMNKMIVELRNQRIHREEIGVAKKGFRVSSWFDDYDPESIVNFYDLHPEEHVLFAEINLHVRDCKSSWEKCLNCGNPFMTTENHSSATCGKRCEKSLNDYMKSMV